MAFGFVRKALDVFREKLDEYKLDMDRLPAGTVHLWDRLGRSGRAWNPKKMHYNPQVRAAFLERGIGVDLLPANTVGTTPIKI